MNFSVFFFIPSKSAGYLAAFLALAISCNNSSKGPSLQQSNKPKHQKIFYLESPILDDVYQINDTLHFTIKERKNITHVDSTIVSVDGKPVRSETGSPLAFLSLNDFFKVGRQNIRIRIFYNDSLSEILTTRITLLSDFVPQKLKYRKIREIPHDENSFTQGLFYHQGFLYEGTGREGKSKLMKIDPADGKILRERKLEEDIFGEGITCYKNQIFQLTYREKIGFVYDLATFDRIREFDLQTAEGWGLTNNEAQLIVSDGSSFLYFYHPEFFNQVNQLDVCTDQSLITGLNELEYINGSVWANVYGRKHLVRIDAISGRVTGILDLSTLFPREIPEDYEHVLNGIAYNSDTHTFFITGKLWPAIFEISIYE
jgi:glutamine cyclotransferase